MVLDSGRVTYVSFHISKPVCDLTNNSHTVLFLPELCLASVFVMEAAK